MSSTVSEGPARRPIDAIVLDYGEVLSHPADPVAMGRMADSVGLSLERFQELYWKYREDYDRGVHDGPAYWRVVSEAAGQSWTREQIGSLIEQDVALWTRLDDTMVDWVRGLIEDGVRVALLSNMVPEIGVHLKTNFGLLARFHWVTLSCEIHAVKPEPAIYQAVLDGLKVPPERVLLIDDRPVNIEGAQAAGMPGIVFRGYDALRRELDARYVIAAG